MADKVKHMTIDETIRQLKIGYINAINYLEKSNEMVSDYLQMKKERDKAVEYMRKSVDLSEVDGDTTGICDGFVSIVHGFDDDTFAKVFNTFAEDEKAVTLNDCLNVLRDAGIEEPMTTVVTFESATHGEIYKYNEYRDKKWRFAGYTRGYA